MSPAAGPPDDEPRLPTYDGQWDLFAIYCRDFHAASRHAAAQGWWLHCWQWRTDDAAPEEPQVIVLREPDPDHPSSHPYPD